ncbi:MAG: FKBP-type peptidyl-prolyl cis-trans isomerase [Salibacteraceae bacterium]
MKKGVFTLMMICTTSLLMAQRASGTKQDEMLSKQEQIEEQLGLLLKQQEQLINMYGNAMNAENEIDLMSYAYGLSIGENFAAQGMRNINYGAFMKGMTDALMQKKALMTQKEAQDVINKYMGKIMEARSEEARKAGEKFLEENAKRKEVMVTESGLQYEVVEEGKGESPEATNKVTVHYEGKTLDGQIFDSSKQRGEPASFGLNQVIKGWTEGLQLMNKGAVYKLYIPSELAYGDQGAGQVIGPGETLIFEVELIDFE